MEFLGEILLEMMEHQEKVYMAWFSEMKITL